MQYPAAGAPALSSIYPTLTLPMSTCLDLMPDSTKTGAADRPMEAVMTGDIFCCQTWLHRTLAAYAAAGHPVQNCITRPLNKLSEIPLHF